MVLTVQEAIEQAREREELFKTARKGIKEESLERFKSYLTTPFKKRVVGPLKKADVKVGKVVRKAVHLLAPKTSMVRRITATTKKKVSGRGRGRPKETYKTRVLPSGKIVKVPTHIYKKMLSQEKAAIRLAQAQRQALIQQQVEQIAITQDPRFQPSAEDAWVDSEDMEHEAEVQRLKQQQLIQQQMYRQQQIQRPTIAKRAGEMFGKTRISLMGTVQPPQYQPQYARQYPQQPTQAQPYPAPQLDMERHRPTDPQVIVLGGKSPMFGGKGNIMDQKNEFNETNRAIIGFSR